MFAFDQLGHRIKLVRLQAHLTQEAFGHLFGVSKQTVSMWEMGAYRPTPDRLHAIADFSGHSVYELEKGFSGPEEDSYFYTLWEQHASEDFLWILNQRAPEVDAMQAEIYQSFHLLLTHMSQQVDDASSYAAFKRAVQFHYAKESPLGAVLQEEMNAYLETWTELQEDNESLREVLESTQNYYASLDQVYGIEDDFKQGLYFKTLYANLKEKDI